MLDFSNTVPANTPEITMQEPKIPMSKRIRAYKAANPNATSKQIADATGATVIYVYQVLSDSSKNEKKAKPVAKPKENGLISEKELGALVEEIKTQRIVIDALKRTVDRNHAVIEYLEFKIDDMGGLVC